MADDTNTAEREAAEQWLRDRYGAYRGHFAWRELEEAFLAGRASLAASAGIACQCCGGSGEVFEHSEDCDDDLCALNGDEHSCTGVVRQCSCKASPIAVGATQTHIAAMERAWLWMENQADAQSKGGHATFDLLMLREERDALRAAIDAAASAGSEPVAAGSIDHLKLMMEESAWGGQILLSDALANIDDFVEAHPSPPEGMAGWRQGVEAAAALLSKKADDFAKEHGHDDMGGLSFGRGAHADAKLDYHSGLLELADEVREMRSEATPELSSDNRVLMEHSGCGRGTQIDTLTVRLNPGDKVILCPGPVTRASITAPPLPASEAKEL